MDTVLHNVIKKCIDNGEKHFIIAPMGNWGNKVKSVLQEYEIQPVFCLDNFCFDMEQIFPIKHLAETDNDAIVILAVQDIKTEVALYEQIQQHVPKGRIIRVFEEISISKKRERICQIDNIPVDKRVKLDFLCVGIEKSGSTSLDAFLRKNTNIGMPLVKSTRFLLNPSESTHEVYLRRYEQKVLEKKVCGGVEVSYFQRAEEVFHYYGEDLKIIFLLRNPVNVLYSLFKHNMREGQEHALEFISKEKRVSLDSFEDYIQEYRDRCKIVDLYKYVEWIKEYLQWYPRNQIMIIVCEEMYAYPNSTMKQLQKFIGLQESEIIECDRFPHANRGDVVAKNHICASINNAIMNLYNNHYCSWETDEIKYLTQIRELIFEQTTAEFQDKISQALYEKLLGYYMDSIKELEEIVERSFEGIWY